jgi:hypothetical protein
MNDTMASRPLSRPIAMSPRVGLSRRHSPPSKFTIENNGCSTTTEVEWVPPDQRITRAWANWTEDGASCCVLAGIKLTRGLYAVRRAETRAGADHYIGPAGSGIEDLEDCSRLEVSGLDEGCPREIRQRVLVRINQARRGDSNLPAIAGVVGFG